MQKRDMRSCGNNFFATGIFDAILEMGEATHPTDRKLFPKTKPAGGF
jgi:hypothetical protein